MTVKLVDLKAQHEALKKEIDEAIHGVIATSSFIQGPELKAFEADFASFVGASHAVGVSSGTSAIQLALLAAGIKPGDEVITSPFTFIATAEGIRHVGAFPTFVDVEKDTLCLDPALIEAAVTPKTKAIVAVHLYGQPAAMDPILDIAKRRQLTLIEDCAQAHGAVYKGKTVGTIGNAGCFSFFPAKNLGAFGDAGGVVSNDTALASSVRLLRDHGRRDKYEHEIEGFNHRMDTLHAAVLRVKLKYLKRWNDRRRAVAALYREGLGKFVTAPPDKKDTTAVFHLFVIQTPRRDALKKHLADKGIESGIHYPIPLHRQPAFSFLNYKEGRFPVSEEAAKSVLSLPIYPEMTDDQIGDVISAVRSFF